MSEVQPPSAVVGVSFGSSDMDDVEFRGAGLKRDRALGASMRSTTSTKSVVSLSPNAVTSAYTASSLFSFRTGAIDSAVTHCKTAVVKPEIDGEVTGHWLITEIDHWDMEKEKLVLLTKNCLLIIRYDFIRLVPADFRRIFLKTINRIQIGDLVYPAYSLMASLRQHGGARIYWGSGEEPSFAQRWNPFCSDLGYVTLSHHLLAYKPDERETVTYDVADLIDSVIAAVNAIRRGGDSANVPVENGTISIESYGSLMSLVFNQSHLGFNLARGGVSF